MAKTPPTPTQIALQELGDLRQRMRDAMHGIGEPAVEIPAEDIGVISSDEGEPRLFMRMDKLINIVDRLIRNPPIPSR